MEFQSVNEENVYYALQQLKVEFDYQVPIGGGRFVRGGQVIDFVLHVPPKPIALYIQGDYWHTGRKALEDDLKQTEAEKRGYYVAILRGDETSSVNVAKASLKAKVL